MATKTNVILTHPKNSITNTIYREINAIPNIIRVSGRSNKNDYVCRGPQNVPNKGRERPNRGTLSFRGTSIFWQRGNAEHS